jgi:hypothetical protein
MLEPFLIQNRASRTETSLLLLYTGTLSADRQTKCDLFIARHKARAYFTDAESDPSFLIHHHPFLLIFYWALIFQILKRVRAIGVRSRLYKGAENERYPNIREDPIVFPTLFSISLPCFSDSTPL